MKDWTQQKIGDLLIIRLLTNCRQDGPLWLARCRCSALRYVHGRRLPNAGACSKCRYRVSPQDVAAWERRKKAEGRP